MMDALPLHDARKAGLREGMEKGLLAGERKKAIETAKKMLENEIPIDLITECTGLSLEEVKRLKD